MRRRVSPAPVPPQEPADERCDYIPVPPVGYDDEGYPVEDSVSQSQRHTEQIADWHGALRDWCRRRGLGEVFSDLTMPYRRGQRNKVVVPDLMVALRAERREERLSYKLWEQPTPEFALESLSNSTWRADVHAKRRLYQSLGVREYWLFDATGKRVAERLRGYRLRAATPGGRAMYRLVRENRWGRRPSKVLGLELCVLEGELRFHDPASGEFLRTARESHVRAREADAERRRADAEQQCAATERERANREHAARHAADMRVAALEAQLRALRQSD